MQNLSFRLEPKVQQWQKTVLDAGCAINKLIPLRFFTRKTANYSLPYVKPT